LPFAAIRLIPHESVEPVDDADPSSREAAAPAGLQPSTVPFHEIGAEQNAGEPVKPGVIGSAADHAATFDFSGSEKLRGESDTFAQTRTSRFKLLQIVTFPDAVRCGATFNFL
jgi:hypothetical protein